MPDFWIQLENKAWDVCPNDLGRDRMTGQTAQARSGGHAPVMKTLTSPVTGAVHNRQMFQPLDGDALIYRRYTANWAAPDDRKVNPWDLNEPDPTDSGTMGTIPGPVLEFNVGDAVTVHFRNLDMRTRTVTSIEEIELFPTTEGSISFGPFFPPIDIDLFIPHETQVPLDVLRRTHSIHPHGVVFPATSDGAYPLSPPDPGNLVPVGPQVDPILEMDRVAWTTAGFAEGAQKKGDRVPPGGLFTYTWNTFGWPPTAGVWLYHDHSVCDDENVSLGAIGIIVIHNGDDEDVQVTNADFPGGSPNGSPVNGGVYRTPPGGKAQYLQLFHILTGQGMLINGRKYLGNTPTMVAGPQTKMRFGVVGMGSDTHTFHIHGHRWIIPGPAGTPLNANNAIPNPFNAIVSQFEDTRVFGPANSFVFTVQEGTSFMRAEPPVGEWHMHCHVLMHMMDGMMGSLLVVNDGDPAVTLPVGEPCPPMPPSMAGASTVSIEDFQFNPANVTINAGDTVHWVNNGSPHTVTSNGKTGAVFNCAPASAEMFDSGNMIHGATFDHMFMNPGSYSYHCDIHGCMMAGTITVH
jgi:plastocyanin/FtsP/CotA-like multicopper oxidase with cupredoxin domain